MLAVHYDTLDSTSNAAMKLSKLNPGRAVLVSARVQTAGRGRTGRPWVSPRGGAWFSVAWPLRMTPQQARPASLVVGLAVRDAVAETLSAGGADAAAHTLRIKWPNDLLLDGGKIAGILCEQTLNPICVEPDYTCYTGTLVIGVGINANLDVAQLGGGLRQPAATLLQHLRQPIDLADLITRCSQRIEAGMDRLERSGFEPAQVQGLNASLAWKGDDVALAAGTVDIRGQLRGVDDEGNLELHTEAGVRRFASGEVRSLRMAEPLEPARV